MMSYAVLGPSGTFSEEAARLYAGDHIDIHVTNSIPALFALVESGQISDGLVPLENSSAGMIATTLECLAASPLKIKGAIEVAIRQYLLANGDYKLSEVELLISQPVAMEQCRNFIEVNLQGARKEITDSTARAAELVQQEKRRAAAIGSKQAAQLYGLQIIASDIQEVVNYTRFVHIAQNGADAGERQKSSLILSLPDKVGALYELLGAFARENMNLSKIESRPASIHGNYIFYIEVEQGKEDLEMELLLQVLEPYCNWLKYLGSYTQRRISYVDCGSF